MKWAKDGKGYYAVESNSLVRYDLPSFARTVIADAKQLTPAGKDQPVAVQGFSCSDDEKKWLLFTNSKKVWRLNTRGDYWVLDLSTRQYKDGYANYQALLGAQQAYQQARITLVQAQANRYADTAALFQALGGGWWHRSELARNDHDE